MSDKDDGLVVKDLLDCINIDNIENTTGIMRADNTDIVRDFILKCNLCNYTFLELESLLCHAIHNDHKSISFE